MQRLIEIHLLISGLDFGAVPSVFMSGNSILWHNINKSKESWLMTLSMAKDEARKIIDSLPEQATWDDIMYQFYIKRKIEISLKAFEEGKVIPHEAVVQKLLPQ
jgi:hypothetical protein